MVISLDSRQLQQCTRHLQLGSLHHVANYYVDSTGLFDFLWNYSWFPRARTSVHPSLTFSTIFDSPPSPPTAEPKPGHCAVVFNNLTHGINFEITTIVCLRRWSPCTVKMRFARVDFQFPRLQSNCQSQCQKVIYSVLVDDKQVSFRFQRESLYNYFIGLCSTTIVSSLSQEPNWILVRASTFGTWDAYRLICSTITDHTPCYKSQNVQTTLLRTLSHRAHAQSHVNQRTTTNLHWSFVPASQRRLFMVAITIMTDNGLSICKSFGCLCQIGSCLLRLWSLCIVRLSHRPHDTNFYQHVLAIWPANYFENVVKHTLWVILVAILFRLFSWFGTSPRSSSSCKQFGIAFALMADLHPSFHAYHISKTACR